MRVRVRTVEVDETFIWGKKPGKRGRGAAGKVLVGIAAEDKGEEGKLGSPRGSGRDILLSRRASPHSKHLLLKVEVV